MRRGQNRPIHTQRQGAAPAVRKGMDMNHTHGVRAAIAAVAMLLSSVVPGLALRAPTAVPSNIEPGQVMVAFRPGTPPAAAVAALRGAGAAVVDRIESLDTYLVRVAGAERAAAAALRRLPGVQIAEANITGRVQAAPPPSRANDPLVKGIGPTFADRQWHLNRINAPYAWTVHPRTYYSARTKPQNALKIAVIDTWIDTGHNDWKNAGGSSPSSQAGGQLDLRNAVSFVPAGKLRGALDWHGTYVAGIIGASTDNTVDIAGIAYSAQIMPVVVARGDGGTNSFAVAKGITHAVDRGAKVINVSLALQNQKANEVGVLRAAVNRAVAKGALIVAAVGNDRSGDDAEFPAGFAAENSGVVAVGASDHYDQRAFCSKKGRHLTLLAPGTLLWGLDPQRHDDSRDHTTRREVCGTSYAAAVVSGVAGLVADRYRGITPSAIRQRLASGADDLGAPGRDDETGAGRLNAERALWPGGGPKTWWQSIPVAGEKNYDDVAAVAENAAGVTQAEILIDGMQRGRGVVARAADGRWRGRSERLVTRINTDRMSEGPHEIHIRARDAKGMWGPAAAGVLIVDRTAPKLSGVTCYPRAAIYPDDPASAIRFAIEDTWSPSMSVKIVLLDPSFTPAVSLAFPAVPTGTYGRPTWKEIEAANKGPILPGLYRLIVTVRDMAAHEVYAESPCLVLPTTRSVPSPNASSGPGGMPAVPTGLPTTTPSPHASITSQVPTPTASPSVAPN